MNIQSKLPGVGLSIFSEISALAKEYNAVNLGQGFPGFKVDPEMIDAVSKAMQNGYNQYAPMQGIPELRAKIATIVSDKYGRVIGLPNITITAGATQAIFNTIAAFVNKGDEVIILDPSYDCYAPAVELMGGKPVHVQLDIRSNELPKEDIVKAINDKTRLVVWNNPHNPSGNVYGDHAIDFWEEIAAKNPDLLFLSDEVYEHIDFTNTFRSFNTSEVLRERSVITSSFGKTFHATGWKMGYAVAPVDLIKEFNKVHQYNVFAVNHAVQKGLADYISVEKTQISEMYAEKRNTILKGIKTSRFEPVGGGGTYFQLLDFKKISPKSDVAFVQNLIEEHKVATIPVSGFNKSKLDQKVIRLCFAKENETLEQAIEILCKI